MAEADRGRVVKPSTRTVAQFFAEWFAAIEPSIDATTWANTYVIPRIGGERLRRLDEPQLLRLYGQLLAEGRVKRDGNGEMYAYWADRVAKGEAPTAREVSDACETTLHAARAAVRRYKSGIIPIVLHRHEEDLNLIRLPHLAARSGALGWLDVACRVVIDVFPDNSIDECPVDHRVDVAHRFWRQTTCHLLRSPCPRPCTPDVAVPPGVIWSYTRHQTIS